MTAYRSVDVICDWPDCYARIRTHNDQLTKAREWAEQYGWKRLAGIVDLCGSREQGRESYSSDSSMWHGHSAREDHVPVVKPSEKGYALLSCTCGWDYTAPYSWQPKGAATRSMLGHYWTKHVKEADAEAAKSANDSNPANS